MALLRLSHHGTQEIVQQFSVKDPVPSSRLYGGPGSATSPRRALGAAQPSPWDTARLPPRNGQRQSSVDYMKIASSWDRGSRRVRERLLEDFVENCKHMTGPQLERELGLGASLFLTRVTAWLRLTYLLNYNLAVQMEAIGIFLSASGGTRYLSEFLEIGGALTLLEMISLPQVKERDKANALCLLIHIASAGRRHKEFICECQGIRAVSECLARSRFDLTQDYARHLMQELGTGNPKYLMAVYKALLALLTSPSSLVAQQMAGQALRSLLPSIPTIHVSIVEATLSLLKSNQLALQHEAFELLRELLPRDNLQEAIIAALVDVLQMAIEDGDADDHGPTQVMSRGKRVGRLRALALDRNGNSAATVVAAAAAAAAGGPAGKNDLATLPPTENFTHLYIQQAYAARLLGSMAAMSPALCERMVAAGALMGLVMAIANVKHPDTQRHASGLLHYLCDTTPAVADVVKEHLGSTFFDFFSSKPDTYYRELNREQVRYLRRNAVRLRGRPVRTPARGRDEMPMTPEQSAAAAAAAAATAAATESKTAGGEESTSSGSGSAGASTRDLGASASTGLGLSETSEPQQPAGKERQGSAGARSRDDRLGSAGRQRSALATSPSGRAGSPRSRQQPSPLGSPTRTSQAGSKSFLATPSTAGGGRSSTPGATTRTASGANTPLGGKLVAKQRIAGSTASRGATPASAASVAFAMLSASGTPASAADPVATADALYVPIDPTPVAGSLTARVQSSGGVGAATSGASDDPDSAAARARPTVIRPGGAASSAAVATGRVEAALTVDDAVRKIHARPLDAELRSRFPERAADGAGGGGDSASSSGGAAGLAGMNGGDASGGGGGAGRAGGGMGQASVAMLHGLSEDDDEMDGGSGGEDARLPPISPQGGRVTSGGAAPSGGIAGSGPPRFSLVVEEDE
ncbi:hypothetical protein H9P43_009886 [Blastocladiella emersonii ATCC 22665]|nr:hypothetical protein H9P43_009886 [Blastocladiella emersonii ATCC 22665]